MIIQSYIGTVTLLVPLIPNHCIVASHVHDVVQRGDESVIGHPYYVASKSDPKRMD
jgi:hypothetical protein